MGNRRNGLVFGVCVLLVFVAVFGVLPNVPAVKGSRTWTVDNDGSADFSSIQQAINSPLVAAGDTIFVNSGTYYENVVINKTVSLIGENKDTAIVDGGKADFTNVVKVLANDTVFNGFTATGGGLGSVLILLNETSNTVIADNNLIGEGSSVDAIRAYSSTNITLTGNKLATDYGVRLIKSFNNTVRGNIFPQVGGFAVQLSSSSNNSIVGNNITGEEYPQPPGFLGIGVHLTGYQPYLPGANGSSYNTFCDNNFVNIGTAIYTDATGSGGGLHLNNVFLRNTIENYGNGLYMICSSNSIFKDNIFSKNHGYNIGVYGSSLSEYIHNIDTSNTVNGKPVYYLVNQKNLRIDPVAFPDIGYLAIINSTNITVENLNLKENRQGLLMVSTQNSTILNNDITNNNIGIYMDILTSNSIVSQNNIANQNWAGILSQSSFNNSLTRNTVLNNTIGIYLKTSFNNTLTYNRIGNNSRGGVWLDYSFNNILESNSIENNSAEEISDAGVSLYLSYTNRIFHNNFINNQRQAYSPLGNFWDDGYPSGGNYWSDYTGVDEESGPNQDQLGSDGIGDTPYSIDTQNRDGYPLMNPRILPDITRPVTTISLSGVLGDNDWYKSDVLVTLSATDDTEVDKTEYSFEDTTWITYSTPFTITNEGDIIVYYKSTDKAGNAEIAKSKATKIDKTKPLTNAGEDQTINEDVLVTFNGSASQDRNGIAAYTWTFTDVTPKTLTGEKPTYTFNTPGLYAISLNATDVAGNWATDTVVITVLDVTNPVSNAGQDQTVNVGTEVTFDASSSADNVGIVGYEWNFGDGTTGTGKTATHTYNNAETYTVTLTVKDAAGNMATDSATIMVLSTEAFPTWIVGVAVAAIAVVAAAILLLIRRK